jgi:hypothetical protein
MRRWFGALSIVVVSGLVAGCGSTPWWQGFGPGGVSACGGPAWARVAGNVMAAGDCAGYLVIPAGKVTLHVGGEIDVRMTEDSSGDSTRLVPVYPLPHSSRSSVLKHTATSPDGAAAMYIAEHPGHAMLISHGSCFGPRPIVRYQVDCPVLDVTVIP